MINLLLILINRKIKYCNNILFYIYIYINDKYLFNESGGNCISINICN